MDKIPSKDQHHLVHVHQAVPGALPEEATNVQQPERRLLRPQEAADYPAISPRTLWGLTNRGDLCCVRVGRAVRYDPEDLTAWIARHKSKAHKPSSPG